MSGSGRDFSTERRGGALLFCLPEKVTKERPKGRDSDFPSLWNPILETAKGGRGPPLDSPNKTKDEVD
jgi:hypothetical protein